MLDHPMVDQLTKLLMLARIEKPKKTDARPHLILRILCIRIIARDRILSK